MQTNEACNCMTLSLKQIKGDIVRIVSINFGYNNSSYSLQYRTFHLNRDRHINLICAFVFAVLSVISPAAVPSQDLHNAYCTKDNDLGHFH